MRDGMGFLLAVAPAYLSWNRSSTPGLRSRLGWKPLPGTAKSAELVQSALAACHYRTWCLLGGAATLARILAQLSRIATQLPPGAVLVLYLCGHGGLAGGLQCFVDDEGAIIRLRALIAFVAHHIRGRAYLVVLADCCRTVLDLRT